MQDFSQYLQKYSKLVSREAVLRELFCIIVRDAYCVEIDPKCLNIQARNITMVRIPPATKNFIRTHSNEICTRLNQNEFGFVIESIG